MSETKNDVLPADKLEHEFGISLLTINMSTIARERRTEFNASGQNCAESLGQIEREGAGINNGRRE